MHFFIKARKKIESRVKITKIFLEENVFLKNSLYFSFHLKAWCPWGILRDHEQRVDGTEAQTESWTPFHIVHIDIHPSLDHGALDTLGRLGLVVLEQELLISSDAQNNIQHFKGSCWFLPRCNRWVKLSKNLPVIAYFNSHKNGHL